MRVAAQELLLHAQVPLSWQVQQRQWQQQLRLVMPLPCQCLVLLLQVQQLAWPASVLWL
jgi:hypothetical protein